LNAIFCHPQLGLAFTVVRFGLNELNLSQGTGTVSFKRDTINSVITEGEPIMRTQKC
jgi:hypothetical protein